MQSIAQTKTEYDFPSWVTVEGTQTLLAEKHDKPIITLALTFPVGSYADPDHKFGLAALFGEMLLRGTKLHTREQIEDKLDELGASLVVVTGYASMIIQGQVLTRNIAPFVDLLLEMLIQSNFPEKELNILRDQTIAELYRRLEQDSHIAKTHFAKHVFKNHPYGRDVNGTPETLKVITQKDIQEFYNTHFTNDEILIGGAGDVDRSSFNHIVTRIVSSLPKGKACKQVKPYHDPLTKREIIVIDKPDRTQTHFLLGHPSIDAKHKDFFPLSVFVNAFAGSMFQAQYMQEIRVKRGWSYGAYGSLDTRRDGGMFFLYTYPKTEDTIPAIKLSIDLLDKAVNEKSISDEELNFSKKRLARSFPFVIEVPEKLILENIYNKQVGRADDYLNTYVANIESVTPEQAREAAKRNLNSKNLMISILCTAKNFPTDKLKKELSADTVTVVPYNQF